MWADIGRRGNQYIGDATVDNLRAAIAATPGVAYVVPPQFNGHKTGAVLVAPNHTRADYDSTTLTVPSFNSGLVIKATDIDTVRLTAARGLQVPSLFDFGIQIPLSGLDYVGSPYLQPTSIWHS